MVRIFKRLCTVSPILDVNQLCSGPCTSQGQMFATSAVRDVTKDVRNVCLVCWIHLIDKSKITKSRFRGQMHLYVRCKEFVDELRVSHDSNFHPKSVRQNAMKSNIESV